MTEINIYLSIITLNVNGLNSPVKRNRLLLWVRKKGPSSCCLQERHLNSKDKDWGEAMEGSTPGNKQGWLYYYLVKKTLKKS